MKKWILTLLLLIASNNVFSDGMVFSIVSRGRDWGSSVPVTEENQHAIIAHKDGREAMLLAINFHLNDDEKAFWLFPVPGKPEEVKADIVDVFPRIRGIKPTTTAQIKFLSLLGTQIFSQPYTWPFMCCMSSLGSAGRDFNVHSVVEKHGLTIETLSAKTAGSLALYLKGKEIHIAESELIPFSDYLNDQYSLIFVEVSSREALLKQFPEYEHFKEGDNGRWPAVFVEFPSEKIFFPLKPTGFYNESVKINVKVLDYVKNEKALSDSWRCGYYYQMDTEEPLPDVFKSYAAEGPLCYTKFEFFGDAADLTDDLWMTPFVPKSIQYAQFVEDLSQVGDGFLIIVLEIVIFLLQSWTCAGVTGLIFFRKWHPYALLGLGNIVTLFGVHLLLKYGKLFPQTESQGDEKKLKSFRLSGYTQREIKRREFLFLFSLFFMMSSIMVYVLLTLPFYGT